MRLGDIMSGKSTLSKTFVWIILGLLFVGLAGFGATNLSGTVTSVGTVGTKLITVDSYARELQREMRAVEAQTRQPLSMQAAAAAGLDRLVLARLVTLAALDNEADEIGLSIGDENLQQEIVEIPSFHDINGQFDRETYRFALDQAGISEAAFESDLRSESARTLMQGAVMAGVEMPDVMAGGLLDYIAARCSFTWAPLTAADLEAPLPDPGEVDLKAYYEANAESFTLPETKELRYVLLTPDMILDQVDVDDAALRTLFEERAAEYNIPERRLVERLVFADDAAASSALAQLEVGGTTFEQLVRDRGLSLGDIDLGDVTTGDLEGAADAVFAAEVGDVVGPEPSPLGPALFRVNGTLSAQVTAFEDAVPELRDELARDRARRLVETQSPTVDDLLAGGATLDEVAAETDAELGQISWTEDSLDGPAAYQAFRAAASAVSEDDFPAVAFLEGGGIFALELVDSLPARPEPFESARNRVIDGWTVEATEEALRQQAATAVAAITSGTAFAEAGLTPKVENGLTRTAFIEATGPGFMAEVFEMDVGEVRVLSAGGAVQVVRLDRLVEAEDTAELAQLRRTFNAQMNQALSQALFNAFATDAQLRARPQIDQRAISLVQNNFQ